MTQVKNIHIFVEGRVQGVGFRKFAQIQAQKLGLRGWSRNLLDGRVEILAAGPLQTLNEYVELIRRGPSFANVRQIETHFVEDAIEILAQDFEIKPDEEMP